MKQFLKKIFANYIGNILFSATLPLLFASLGAYLYQDYFAREQANNRLICSSSKQVLHIKLKGGLLDRRPYEGIEIKDGNIYLSDLQETLTHAAQNPSVEGVLLELDDFSADLVVIDSLVHLIKKFKKSGKPVVCYSTNCGQIHLYIAAQADYHILYPLGEVYLLGFSNMRYFYKGFMDIIGVKFSLFRSGASKDAAEHLTQEQMSPEAKKNRLLFLQGLDKRYLKGIAEGRHIDIQDLQKLRGTPQKSSLKAQEDQNAKEEITYLDEALSHPHTIAWLSALEAVNHNLADQVGYFIDAKAFFSEKREPEQPPQEVQKEGLGTSQNIGTNPDSNADLAQDQHSPEAKQNHTQIIPQQVQSKPPLFIPNQEYKKYYCKKRVKKIIRKGQYKAGICRLEGEIREGESRPGVIGSEDTIQKMYECAEAYDVLFLEIDSPGGSAVASDKIRATIREVRAGGTYVIIVMRSLCASGGLLIASAGDEIWCFDASIVGSVGVFMAYPHWQGLLEKLKINVDGVLTNPSADLNYAHYRDFTQEEKELFQKFVDIHFEHFLTVAGREGKLSREEVLSFAGGKVFLGQAALDYGIADQIIDDLEEAIQKKMEERYPDATYTIHYENEKLRLHSLFFQLRLYFTKALLGPQLYEQYRAILEASAQKREVQARYF